MSLKISIVSLANFNMNMCFLLWYLKCKELLHGLSCLISQNPTNYGLDYIHHFPLLLFLWFFFIPVLTYLCLESLIWIIEFGCRFSNSSSKVWVYFPFFFYFNFIYVEISVIQILVWITRLHTNWGQDYRNLLHRVHESWDKRNTFGRTGWDYGYLWVFLHIR